MLRDKLEYIRIDNRITNNNYLNNNNANRERERNVYVKKQY